MQAQAAEFSGYAGQSCCFWEEEFKNSLLGFIYLDHALKETRRRLFESFLVRNEIVATPSG